MFSEARDASKIALVYLCARLIRGNFTLLDTQFVTDHLKQFGTVEVGKSVFHRHLEHAMQSEGDFWALPVTAPPDEVLATIASIQGPTT
jgi:leucyl/phenylalanyl-tRNA--protein transferase